MAKKTQLVMVKPRNMSNVQAIDMGEEEAVYEAIEIGGGNGGAQQILNGMGLVGPQLTQRRLGLSKWKVSLRIERLTSNIAETLFVPIFGPINQQTDYVPILNRLNKLPAGVTLQFTIDQNGRGIYTFTEGLNVDICRVSSNTQVSYSEILQMINAGGYLTSDMVRYDAGTDYAAQFSAGDILATTNTLSGIITNDSADVAANKSPDQFQNPIIDVQLNLAVDAVYTVVFPMAEAAAPATSRTISLYFQNVLFKSPAQFTRACMNE